MEKNPHLPRTPDEFIKNNMGLAQSVAWRFVKWAHNKENIKFDKDDFLSIAYLGLCKAYEKYDPTNFQGEDGGKIKFSTYAIPMINGEIRRHIRDLSHTIRKSRDGNGPDNLDSLDRTINENENKPMSLADMIQADTRDMNEMVIINDFLDRIDPRSQRVYKLRERGCSQKEIGEMIGLSQVQVSRIEAQLYNFAKQYGRGEMENMPRTTDATNRLRDEIKTLEQFNSIGLPYKVAERYGVSVAFAYNLKKHLEENTQTKIVIESELEEKQFNLNQQQIQDKQVSLDEAWKNIAFQITKIHKMYIDQAEKDFIKKLAQVVGT